MMPHKFLVLSDLHGTNEAYWMLLFNHVLGKKHEVKILDSCTLADISTEDTSPDERHFEFVNGGIDKAVNQLLGMGPGPWRVIAASVGGTIAWKAALNGMDISHLYAISATRLRLEYDAPNAKIKLYYGADDKHRPAAAWGKQMGLPMEVALGQEHGLYEDISFCRRLCDEILAD